LQTGGVPLRSHQVYVEADFQQHLENAFKVSHLYEALNPELHEVGDGAVRQLHAAEVADRHVQVERAHTGRQVLQADRCESVTMLVQDIGQIVFMHGGPTQPAAGCLMMEMPGTVPAATEQAALHHQQPCQRSRLLPLVPRMQGAARDQRHPSRALAQPALGFRKLVLVVFILAGFSTRPRSTRRPAVRTTAAACAPAGCPPATCGSARLRCWRACSKQRRWAAAPAGSTESRQSPALSHDRVSDVW